METPGFEVSRKTVLVVLFVPSVERDGVTALFKQPLAGGQPQEVITLGEEVLFDFGYSSDGKLLAAIRGGWHHDVVLIRDLNRY